MQLAGIRARDIVECDVRGARFVAFVSGRDDVEIRRGELLVEPIGNGSDYRIVRAREVVELWRRSRRSKIAGDGGAG